MLTVYSGSIFAQGGNDCATAQANPITLPFTASGTTCNGTNVVAPVTTSCGVSNAYFSGPDWLYYFCATATQQVSISLTNFNPTNPFSSISVWQGCPTSGGTCIGGTTASTGTSQGLTVGVTNGQCYFIVIDNRPTPNCFSYNISVTPIVPPPPMAQCTNMGFEAVSFNGWYGEEGTISCGPVGAPTPQYNTANVGFINPHITLVTAANGNDQCGNFPQVCPLITGNTTSVRLGNGTTAGYGAARMQQTFTVQQSTPIFILYYAIVVQDAGAGHATNEQPYFQMEMFDQNNNPITCGNYLIVGGPNIPGYQLSANCATTYYKTWTAVSVDLSPFIGNNVTVKFTSGDCCYGGHYSYAYIDAECKAAQLAIKDTICQGSSTQFCAPPGMTSYSWSPGGQTSQCITVSTAGIYNVTLYPSSNPQCFSTVQDTLYVVPLPQPAFTANVPPGCAPITVNFNNTTPGTGNIYSWDFGVSGISTDTSTLTSPSYTYQNMGTYTVTLWVDNGGCIDTIQHIVNINTGISTTFNYTPVCVNSIMTFNGSSPDPINSWHWDFGVAGISNDTSNVQNPTWTYTTPGTYTVTLNVIGGPGGTCPGTYSSTVTVYPLPSPAFLASAPCVGSPVQFTDQSTTNIMNWQWNFGDPNTLADTSIIKNPTYTYPSSGQYNVILIVTDANGCKNAVTTPVNVYPQPLAQYAANTICKGNPTQFSDQSSVTSGGSVNGWAWQFGSPVLGTSSQQHPTYVFPSAGQHIVQLIVTSQAGCRDTIQDTITVYDVPSAALTGTSVCKYDSNLFADISTVNAPDVLTNWIWNYGGLGSGSPSSGVQNPYYIYTNPGIYTVSLIVVTDKGCTDKDSITVQVYPPPNPNFTFTKVCESQPTSFNDLSTVQGGIITGWQWYFGQPGATSQAQNPIYTFPSAGQYTVSLAVQSDRGCVDSVSLPIVVNPIPVPNMVADDTNGCVIHCVNFTDLSTIANGNIVQWDWTFGDSSLSSTQNPQHCYIEPGIWDVSLTVTSAFGCSATYTNTQYIVTHGWPDAEFKGTPNPTNVWNPKVNFTDLSVPSTTGTIIMWSWTYGDNSNVIDTIQHTTHTFPADNSQIFSYPVTLYVMDDNGCWDTVTHIVKIYPEFTFYAPNTFTPNGDGLNDLFFTYAIGVKDFEILIWHRWGDLIWWSDNIYEGWDGTIKGRSSLTVQEDTYVWKVVLTDVFDKKHTYMGHVNVIR